MVICNGIYIPFLLTFEAVFFSLKIVLTKFPSMGKFDPVLHTQSFHVFIIQCCWGVLSLWE